jgi:hypothetical protein
MLFHKMPTGEIKRSIKLIQNTKNEFASFKIADGGSLDIQFLPWLTHTIVGMDMQAGQDVFFTAAINGCSVFVVGNPNAPSVYHAGIDGDMDSGAYTAKDKKDKAEVKLAEAAAKKDSALFWRLLLEKHVPGSTTDPTFAEVNRANYVNDGSKSTIDGGKSTKRANAFEKLFIEKNKGTLKVKTMFPWGCVFGLKSGGWKFYLQENMTILYSDMEGKKPHASSIPIAVTQFYPKGQEKTNLIKVQNTFIANAFEKSDLVFEGWMPK